MSKGIDEIINRQIHNWDRVHSILKRGQVWPEPPASRKPVIAFARQLGCGTRMVVEILSRELGYEIFGRTLIDKVAEDIHVQRRIIDRLDERVRGEIESFVNGIIDGWQVDSAEYLHVLARVLRAFIVQGGVILIGRGSTFMVHHGEGLRVRLMAPLDLRVENLMRYCDIDKKTALNQISESDKQRTHFIRTYFRCEATDPSLYDLTINMGSYSPESAAKMILKGLEQLQEESAAQPRHAAS